MHKHFSIQGLAFLAVTQLVCICARPDMVFAQWIDQASRPVTAITTERDDRPDAADRWFYEQRTFGLGYIPQHARSAALSARDNMSRVDGKRLSAQSSNSVQWKLVGPANVDLASGAHDGRINAIAIDPTDPKTAYAGAAMGGVWKTTNQGQNWTPMTDQTISLAMGAVAVDPLNHNTIYAGTGEYTANIDSYYGEGILKSTDAGKTWRSIGLNNVEAFSRIICHPTVAGIVYASAAKSGGGVYKSTDAGATWTKLAGGLPPANITDLAYAKGSAGDVLYAGIPSHGVYRSDDGGNSWNIESPTAGLGVFSAMRRINLDVDPKNWKYVVAMSVDANGDFEGLQQSSDGGTTWTDISGSLNSSGSLFSYLGNPAQGWYDAYVRIDPTNESHLFVGGLSIWESTDGGGTWQDVGGAYQGGMHPDQHALEFAPSNPQIVYAGCDGGPWLSTDGGNTLTDQHDNMAVTQFYGIAIDQTVPDLTYGGTQDNGTQSGPSNGDWQEVYGGDGSTVAVDQNQPSRVFFMIPGADANLTYRADNGTVSRIPLPVIDDDASGWVKPLVYDSKNNILYSATNFFYYSKSYGANWIREGVTSATTSDSNNITCIDPAGDGSTVVIGTVKGRLYYSTDNGTNWTNRTAGLPVRTITSVRFSPSNANTIYATFSGFGGGHVYRSMDAGATWANLSNNLPDIPCNVIVIDPGNANGLYVGTDVGVFFSPDAGATWLQYGAGLPNVAVQDMAIHKSGHVLRAGTHGRSIWEAPLSTDIVGIITPSSGSVWYIGDTALIAWHGFKSEGTTTVQISLDGGQTWISVATGVTGSSYFFQNMHYPASGNVLVRVFDQQDTVLSALYRIAQRLAGSTLSQINELPIYMYDIAWDPDDNLLWATDFSATDSKIYKIDPDKGTMLGSVNLGGGRANMTGIKYDPHTKHLFIHSANQNSNTSQYFEVTTSGQVLHTNASPSTYGTGILVRADTVYLVDRDPENGYNVINALSVSNPTGPTYNQLALTSRSSPYGGRCLTFDPTTNTLLHTWTDFQGTNGVANSGTLYDSYLLRLDPLSGNELSSTFVQVGGNQQVNVRGLEIDPRDGYHSAWVTVLDDAAGGTSAKLLKLSLVDGPQGTLGVSAPVKAEEYSLLRNYPNPFSQNTEIRYELQKSASVSIEVYDALGRLVSKSPDQYEGQGTHSRTVSLSALPSGSYISTLLIDGVPVDRKKMTLMK